MPPMAPDQLAERARTVERLRAGDKDAIDRFVNDNWPRLVGLARSILHDDQEAQDAAQDALVSALRRIGDLKDPGALDGWLSKITANAALARLRARKSRRERDIDALLPQFHGDGHRVDPRGNFAVTCSARLESQEAAALVRAKIEELPKTYREVIMLRDIMGLDTAAAASVLGIEENNLKVRLHRARQALRTLLEECLED